MIQITANVELWKKADLKKTDQMRIPVLMVTTTLLSFLISPIAGVLAVGLLIWHSSTASLSVDPKTQKAEFRLRFGSLPSEKSAEN
jgi:hypothetical protein